MKLSNTSAAIAIAAMTAIAPHTQGDIVTQWNFNGTSATTVPGGGSSPSASIGSGTASLVGGVTGSFASGVSNGGSSDPVITNPPNFGWGTTTYAAQNVGSGSTGVQFNVSTVGYEDIFVVWDQRHSNTSSRFAQLQYSLDGVTFNDFGSAFEATAGGDTWYNGRSVDLSSIAGADNNANFAVRIVAVFAPSTSAYAASTTSSSYAGSGTWRFDMVTVSGTALPAPGAFALLGLAGLTAASRRRRA